MLRRLWDTRVARAFLGTWVIVLFLAAGGLWLRASDLKRVEREIVVIRTERLCMQPVSCRRILSEILLLATPAQARHLKLSRGGSRRVVRVVARRVAGRNHTTMVQRRGRARPRGRHPPRKPSRVIAHAPQSRAILPPGAPQPSAPVFSPPPVTTAINGPPGLCPEDSTARLHVPVRVIESMCVNVKP